MHRILAPFFYDDIPIETLTALGATQFEFDRRSPLNFAPRFGAGVAPPPAARGVDACRSAVRGTTPHRDAKLAE